MAREQIKRKLSIKRSTLPGAGKGLFTERFIARGEIIVEYKGRITTWSALTDTRNRYLFYVNKNYVIDASRNKKDRGRYANDAKGSRKARTLKNNSAYSIENGKVFIKAIKNIQAGEEILVGYGKEYWDTIKRNGLK